jgi:hypothetical protein
MRVGSIPSLKNTKGESTWPHQNKSRQSSGQERDTLLFQILDSHQVVAPADGVAHYAGADAGPVEWRADLHKLRQSPPVRLRHSQGPPQPHVLQRLILQGMSATTAVAERRRAGVPIHGHYAGLRLFWPRQATVLQRRRHSGSRGRAPG